MSVTDCSFKKKQIANSQVRSKKTRVSFTVNGGDPSVRQPEVPNPDDQGVDLTDLADLTARWEI